MCRNRNIVETGVDIPTKIISNPIQYESSLFFFLFSYRRHIHGQLLLAVHANQCVSQVLIIGANRTGAAADDPAGQVEVLTDMSRVQQDVFFCLIRIAAPPPR